MALELPAFLSVFFHLDCKFYWQNPRGETPCCHTQKTHFYMRGSHPAERQCRYTRSTCRADRQPLGRSDTRSPEPCNCRRRAYSFPASLRTACPARRLASSSSVSRGSQGWTPHAFPRVSCSFFPRLDDGPLSEVSCVAAVFHAGESQTMEPEEDVVLESSAVVLHDEMVGDGEEVRKAEEFEHGEEEDDAYWTANTF